MKRLTCDGSLITIVEDESGTPLDVGRKKRTITTALRRALWARDRGCTFPGCSQKHYLDGHHIKHWANGGETTPYNVTLLCWRHHALLHEGRFRIRRNEDRSLRFERADGRVIPRFGYRLDDMHDDYEVPPDAVWSPSGEGCLAGFGAHDADERRSTHMPNTAFPDGSDTSAEVRESIGRDPFDGFALDQALIRTAARIAAPPPSSFGYC